MIPSKFEMALLGALLFVLSSAVIWVRTANVRSTYEFVRKESELKEVLHQTQDLRIQWTKLTSPQRLKLLSAELKLNSPKMNQVLSLSSPRKTQ